MIRDQVCELDPATQGVERAAKACAVMRGNATFNALDLAVGVAAVGGAASLPLIDSLPDATVERLPTWNDLSRATGWEFVLADEGVAHVYAHAELVAGDDHRRAINPADLLEALTILSGPHTVLLGGVERSIAKRLADARVGRTSPVATKRGVIIRLLAGLESLLGWISSGAALVFVAPGFVLHRGMVHVVAGLHRHQVKFVSFWEQIDGHFYSRAVLPLRVYTRITIGVRAALFALSSSLFFAMALEAKGLGVVMFPQLTNRTMQLNSAELDGQLGALAVVGRHPFALWTAFGAGFMSTPARDEVRRVLGWAKRRRDPGRIGLLVLTPLKMIGAIGSVVDRAATWFAAPIVVATGMLGVAASVTVGFVAAHVVLRLV